MRRLRQGIWLVVFAFFCFSAVMAQSDEKKMLEAQRDKLKKEIRQINSMLTKEQRQKSSVLSQLEHINLRVNKRQELIRITSRELSLLNRQIAANNKRVAVLQKELQGLKTNYASTIRKSYTSKSNLNRALFLLAAENFFQAYKRYQYLKQYTKYRKEQGEELVAKTKEIENRNKVLLEQQNEKQQLFAQNQAQQQIYLGERSQQQKLLNKAKQNEKTFKKQIRDKQARVSAIERRIQSLIRSAISSSNKKAGKKGGNSFALSPADKAVANSFSANKGRFAWPISSGRIKQGYGEYRDPIYPGIKHINHGVHFIAPKNAQARTIFKGEVFRLNQMRNGKWMVFTKHGDYLCVYYPLANLKVRLGQKLQKNQDLGGISPDAFSKETVLKFLLYKNDKKLNPEKWLLRR